MREWEKIAMSEEVGEKKEHRAAMASKLILLHQVSASNTPRLCRFFHKCVKKAFLK